MCADVCAAKKYGACGTNKAYAEKRPNLSIRIIFRLYPLRTQKRCSLMRGNGGRPC